MGKIPPSLRSSIANTNLLKNPPSIQSHNPPNPQKFPKLLTSKNPKSKKTKPQKNPNPQFTLNSPNLSDAKTQFNSLISSPSQTHLDPQFPHSILQSYASIASIPDSISLLRHISKTLNSFSPDRFSYHILLSKSPNIDEARRILNLMVYDGFLPDRATTDIAIKSLCSAGQEDQAIELIKELSAKNSPPDTYTYNFIIRCLCKSRKLSIVYKFIEEIESLAGLKPDLVTYTILIGYVCQEKNLREATRLLSVLKDRGFKPDRFLYNAIMKGYCILDRGSEAVEVYNEMKEEGVEPDIVTYNTLIFGLSRSGRVYEARKFLNVMVEMGHFPDAVTYTSLMNGMCIKNDALGALGLLEEMESKGCSPNSCTYNTLLHGLSKSRNLDKGIEIYGVMKASDMKLEMASYETFVRALCRDGRVGEAYEVFDYAVESKSLNDVSAYSALESILKRARKVKERGYAV